ncbi:MAG TPA: SMC-Scp complex subunit ScpB [Hanamia sp.]|nr:SMC-Scp complex subunit ScpB [Hanamia sp.]
MELSLIIPHIEALIFASDKPLAVTDIVELLNNAMAFIEDRASEEQVEAAIKAIVEKYDAEFYPFGLVESGGGWQFLTKPEYHSTIAQLNGDRYLKKLSVAAIETLSIIAYKQPVTKSEIELIRGVNCDYAVQKLLEKELVVISGRKEEAVGKPLLYSTSKNFMDYFGLNSADDLPKIKEVLNQEIVEATKVQREEEVEAELPVQFENEKNAGGKLPEDERLDEEKP